MTWSEIRQKFQVSNLDIHEAKQLLVKDTATKTNTHVHKVVQELKPRRALTALQEKTNTIQVDVSKSHIAKIKRKSASERVASLSNQKDWLKPIIEEYRSGKTSYKKLAKKYHISPNNVSRLVNGGEPALIWPRKHALISNGEKDKEVLQDIQSRMSYVDLKKKRKVGGSRISELKKDENSDLNLAQPMSSAEKDEALMGDIESGMSYVALKQKHKVGNRRITNLKKIQGGVSSG